MNFSLDIDLFNEDLPRPVWKKTNPPAISQPSCLSSISRTHRKEIKREGKGKGDHLEAALQGKLQFYNKAK